MRKTKTTDYYLKNATDLGWGEHNANLDYSRVELTRKYLFGKSILDIGCGYGLYVDYLAKEGFDATGIDFTSEFINSAKADKQGTFIVSSAEKLPFDKNSFDTVLLFDILEHGDESKILAEAIRVSRKRIIIIVPKTVDETLSRTGVVYRHYIDKSHLREYTEKDIDRIASSYGVKVKKIIPAAYIRNKSVFLALFNGNNLIKKLIREMVFLILPERKFPTEIFAVLDKN